MKKFAINFFIIFAFIIIYLLQANLFTWFRIVGVMPNMFVMLVLFIGLYGHKLMGVIYGVIFGLLLDCFIGSKIGISAILLGTIGIVGTRFDKNFSKDNRITLIVMTIVSTIIYEIGKYAILYIVTKNYIDIWIFVQILLVECIYNAILTIIVYPLIQVLGRKVEREYKESGVLTRYF